MHPLLAGVDSENVSFDRSDRSNNRVIVRNEKGETLTTEEIERLFEFETSDIDDHSVYGYLFLKHFTPMGDIAESIL